MRATKLTTAPQGFEYDKAVTYKASAASSEGCGQHSTSSKTPPA